MGGQFYESVTPNMGDLSPIGPHFREFGPHFNEGLGHISENLGHIGPHFREFGPHFNEGLGHISEDLGHTLTRDCPPFPRNCPPQEHKFTPYFRFFIILLIFIYNNYLIYTKQQGVGHIGPQE